MPFIPPAKDDLPFSIMELARNNIAEALTPYLKDKVHSAIFDEAVNATLLSITHMLTMREIRKSPLGATIMTERASAVKKPGSAPRTI